MSKVGQARKKAERRLYRAIARQAATASPSELKDLAEAQAKLKWGSQGRTDYDYHKTDHQGEERSRPIGFAEDGS